MNDFKPKYKIALWIGLVLFPPTLVFLGPQVFENPAKDPKLTLSWFVILIINSFIPIILIKRIKFEDRWFIVEKYIGTSKRVLYGDVIDFGATLVKYRGGKVKLAGITNVGEFIKSLSEKIDYNEMEGKEYQGEVRPFTTTFWFAIPIFIVPICVYFLPIDPKWMPIITLSLIMAIAILIGKVVEIITVKMLDDNSRAEGAPP